MRFDFYLPDYNICIEYQGSQHTDNNNPLYTEELNMHDELKRNYCKNNQIKLIEISYKDYDKLDWNFLHDLLNI